MSAISNYFFHYHSMHSLYSIPPPLGSGSSPGRVTKNFIPGGSEPFMILFGMVILVLHLMSITGNGNSKNCSKVACIQEAIFLISFVEYWSVSSSK